ncbi:sialate O-acetylesterase [Aestuariibaculum lutulentum]|uniref:Sialate O-acetylesterase n=1 Tax=Aestuariibaculum lutulentum TaxID=2920935 RepID=A0ABS9RIB8_9FLAO|nr:sialate O-acetylesterase [Aestuariibaculum lutulentum]MCH4552692.1 sialate O-acetylesterase [Aestuariibaculum lutulentum]
MKTILSFLILCLSITVSAQVKLPKLFSDGMVMQRNKPIPVWGWAKPHEPIKVVFKNQVLKTKADRDGNWSVVLKDQEAGGPFKMIIKGKNQIELTDILIGEVWICSGQSNMEWPVSQADNFYAEQNDSNFPEIRQFLVEKAMSGQPKKTLTGGNWQTCNKNTVGDFTAVGYFFAKQLNKKLKIPIGIINTSWGGTCVETWTSKEAFQGSPEFKNMISQMPDVDIDELQEQQKSEVYSRIEQVQGNIINASNQREYKNISFNDSNWPEMYAPKLWELQELGDVDGVVWMRKSFNISKEDAGKPAVLELAKIDDQDTTYINGEQVGTTKRYDENRVYKIKEHILKEGLNVISIKIFDYAGGGGIWGEASDLKLNLGQTEIPLSGSWKYLVTDVKSSVSPNSYPSLLFNAMVNPLIPFACQGVLWYQGEANVNRAAQYKKAFPLMIADWRKHWNMGDLPFYFVQLSTFDEFGGNSNAGSKWAELREAQNYTKDHVTNTDMAVTIDIGNPKDIHPTNKQEVGKRLAAMALNDIYQEKIVSRGPAFKSMEIDNNKAILTFNNIGTGLKTSDKYGCLKGFEIAGADQVFHYAQAYIEGDKVIVHSKDVTNPQAVRYGWADDAGDCNLYNKEGFPAIPFRTDNWKTLTFNEIYGF